MVVKGRTEEEEVRCGGAWTLGVSPILAGAVLAVMAAMALRAAFIA